MTGGGGTTRTEQNRTLKRIEELLQLLVEARATIVVSRSGREPISVDFSSTNSLLTTIDGVLDGILAKIIAAPSTEAKQDDIIAKMLTAPSTEAKQDSAITKLNDIDSVLDDIETRVDGLEALLVTTNVLLTTANSNWITNNAALIVDAAGTVLILLDIIIRAASDVVRNSRLGDIRDDTATILTASQGTNTRLDDVNDELDDIFAGLSAIKADTQAIEDAIESFDQNLTHQRFMSIGEAVTAGHLTITDQNASASTVVSNTHIIQCTIGGSVGRMDVDFDVASDTVVRIWEASHSLPSSSTGNPTTNLDLQSSPFGFRIRQLITSPEGVTDLWDLQVGTGARIITIVSGTKLRWYEAGGQNWDAGDTLELAAVVEVIT